MTRYFDDGGITEWRLWPIYSDFNGKKETIRKCHNGVYLSVSVAVNEKKERTIVKIKEKLKLLSVDCRKMFVAKWRYPTELKIAIIKRDRRKKNKSGNIARKPRPLDIIANEIRAFKKNCAFRKEE